jgi:hypothetical protein
LWFLSLRFLEYFSTVPPTSTYESRDWVMLLLCDFFLYVCLKSIFQQSHPISPMKAGIEWCAALLWFLCVWSCIFQQSYPISTYESRDWVMCCSLWFLSLCLV